MNDKIQVRLYPLGPFSEVSVEEWAEVQTSRAHECVELDGEAEPVFLFLAPHPENPDIVVQGIIGLRHFMVEGNYQKDDMVLALQSLAQHVRAFAVLMIHEAWMRCFEDAKYDEAMAEIARRGGVSNFEDRIEVLVTIFETLTNHHVRTWEIVRDEKSTPSIGEELPSAPKSGGRFSTFLHTNPVAKA